MPENKAEALWIVAPGRAEIRSERLGMPGPGELRVRTLASAVSRGTERLVFRGSIPPSEYERMRAPMMAGRFPFPVKYGYASVGQVEAGAREWLGRTVFAMHPHQTAFIIPESAAVAVPEDVPPERAALAANMETALNAVWDAAPGPADRIVVVGAGVVGALVGFLCGASPGAEVTLVDVASSRAALAAQLGLRFAPPDAAPRDCDIVFHTTASAPGLATAFECAGDEAAVVELSWHGAGETAIPLGGAFHSRRLRLVSSQVGRIAPSHRARWSHRRRLEAALGLLADRRLDALLAPAIDFLDLPAKLGAVLAPEGEALCPIIAYPKT